VYAIGEILLVVIGILIALQINNWNEWRKERIQETKVLAELVKTLTRNCALMKADLSDRIIWDKSSDLVISTLQNKLPYHDSLNSHFQLSRLPGALLTLSRARI
jgi:chlorite dismutase